MGYIRADTSLLLSTSFIHGLNPRTNIWSNALYIYLYIGCQSSSADISHSAAHDLLSSLPSKLEENRALKTFKCGIVEFVKDFIHVNNVRRLSVMHESAIGY